MIRHVDIVVYRIVISLKGFELLMWDMTSPAEDGSTFYDIGCGIYPF
jgi:hypothetical protein